MAFRKMVVVIQRLRLQLDHNKSWHWGTTKSFRQACIEFHSVHSEFTEISVKTQTKDLGEMVHYDRSCSLGFIKDKIDEAKTRMKRIEWIPASLQKKAMIIQSSCWPLALYTSDTTYIGQQHYVSLRRSAARPGGILALIFAIFGLQIAFEACHGPIFVYSLFVCKDHSEIGQFTEGGGSTNNQDCL